jgi:hypothetical protein
MKTVLRQKGKGSSRRRSQKPATPARKRPRSYNWRQPDSVHHRDKAEPLPTPSRYRPPEAPEKQIQQLKQLERLAAKNESYWLRHSDPSEWDWYPYGYVDLPEKLEGHDVNELVRLLLREPQPT